MKRKFSAFIVALSAIVLAVIIASGCTFRNGTKTGGGLPSAIADSYVAAESVSLNNIDTAEREKLDLVDAVAAVERSSVEIVTESGYGSGVIVDLTFEENDPVAWKNRTDLVYIITCHHMVSDKGEITVYLPDENCSYENEDYIFSGYVGHAAPSVYNNGYAAKTGGTVKQYAVTLVGGDQESDIALLKLDLNIAAESGKYLSMDKIVKAKIPAAESNYSIRKGETVFSVGNPTGLLPGSVSSGIVSYLDREVSISEVGDMTLMQIDVSTNPGSSGGGLYNLYGELIGITNAGNTNYEGINFAIPYYDMSNGNGFVQIVAQLAGTATENNYGYVTGHKAKFGFSLTVYNNDTTSVYIESVVKGSLADNKLQAGDKLATVTVIREGNQIVSEKVDSYENFVNVLKNLKVGDELKLEVYRIKQRTSFGVIYNTDTTPVPSMITEQFWFCNTGLSDD